MTTRLLTSALYAAMFAGLLTAAESAAGPAKPPVPGPGEPTLDQVRAATAKYKDVNAALKDGYIRDPFDMCDSAEMMGQPASDGAMGIHFFRPDYLGVTAPPNPRVNGTSTYTDFLKPAVLIYEPQANGSLELVAVENLVFIKAWEAAGHTAPPSYYGVPFDKMQDDPKTPLDEAHNFEPHYDRHVWIYRDNPKGVFTPFNPAVSCKNHKGMAHDHMSHDTK